LMVWIGVHPNTFLRKMTPSVQQLITTVQQGGERGQTMVAKHRVILSRGDGEGSQDARQRRILRSFASLRMTGGRP
jgi:hypothetical protein